jgi:hypothetical protein
MSIIFPRLDPNLVITTAVEEPTAVKTIEAIKHEVVQKLTQIGTGKHIQGEVLAKLSDGSFVAKVDGMPLRLALPANTQVGEKLSLTLLHLTPRPVFLLNGQSQVTLLDPQKKTRQSDAVLQNFRGGRAPIDLAPPQEILKDIPRNLADRPTATPAKSPQTQASTPHASTANQTNTQATETSNQLTAATKSLTASAVFAKDIGKQYELASVVEASSQTELSATGQLINKLLQETSLTAGKLSIKGNTPLLTEAAYKLSAPELKQELETNLRKNISSSGLFYESHVAEWSVGKRTMTELQAEPQAKIALGLENSILTNKENGNHSALAQLIHQQLNVLEHQKFNWAGMLAPQIPMQWSIEESAQHPQSTEPEETAENQYWQSDLRVELPILGTVTMKIKLSAGQLQLNVKSQDQTTVALLKSQYNTLQAAIENTGTHIQTFTVQRDEQA